MTWSDTVQNKGAEEGVVGRVQMWQIDWGKAACCFFYPGPRMYGPCCQCIKNIVIKDTPMMHQHIRWWVLAFFDAGGNPRVLP